MKKGESRSLRKAPIKRAGEGGSAEVLRQKAITEYRVATGWSTSTHQSIPSTRPNPDLVAPGIDIPFEHARSNITTHALLRSHRESLRLNKPSLLLGSWTADSSSSGWGRRTMRVPLQTKVQTFRRVESVRLFDLQRPKAVVQSVPPLSCFYMPRRNCASKGGGFKGMTSAPNLHCKFCQRLEHLHSQPVRGDMRISAALFPSPTVKAD